MTGWIEPDWPAPGRVRALVTTRSGTPGGDASGASRGTFAHFNLAMHVGDDAAAVAANRASLRKMLPAEPLWLNQAHGARVAEAGGRAGASSWGGLSASPAAGPAAVHATEHPTGPPEADAAVAHAPGAVLAVLTADCLPILLCDRSASVVAVAHAGWRGLAAGVIENAVRAMAVPPASVIAWLGPAIGPQSYEVGSEVVEVFTRADPAADAAFAPRAPGKYLADLYALARQRLCRVGVTAVSGGDACTYSDAARFFSYRRDGATGRMASLVWMEEN